MEQPEQSTTTPGILVETVACIVRRDGTAISLTSRERELSIALAVLDRAVSTRGMAVQLYPDRDPAQAVNLIKVYVCRIRKRVGPGFVESRGEGYALAEGVETDVKLARSFIDRLSGSSLRRAEYDAGRALSLARGLRSAPPDYLADLEWYAPTALRARRIGQELAVRVGLEALERGAAVEAARIARELVYEDPSDEEAVELLVRARFALGQLPAAVNDLRHHEMAVEIELNAAPSPHLRGLLTELSASASPATLRS
jgi:DNA-binding SARP family transcriptional activator